MIESNSPRAASSPKEGPPADYHRAKARSFWPDQDEYANAKAALEERGRYISDYLRACLRWLNDSPAQALGTLQDHWPPPRRPGRPPAPPSKGDSERPDDAIGLG